VDERRSVRGRRACLLLARFSTDPAPRQPPASWPLLPSKIANGGRDDALTVVGVMQISQRGALLETAAAAVRL